jgi:hypothetical protein
VFVAEIACIMCTAIVGTAIDTRWPPVLTVLIEFKEFRVLRRVDLDRSIALPAARGNTEATEVTPRLSGANRADWRLERPRVGRRRSGLQLGVDQLRERFGAAGLTDAEVDAGIAALEDPHFVLLTHLLLSARGQRPA